MRIAFILVALSASLGCGTTPTQDVHALNVATCKRVFACLSAQDARRQDYGASEAECAQKLDDLYSTYITDSQPCPDPGKTWHSDRARACVRYIEGLPCGRIPDGLTGSGNPDCANVCS